MREIWARRIALITGLLVIVLAAIFALIQNPSRQDEHMEAEHMETKNMESRQQIYAEQTNKPANLEPSKIKAGKEVYRQQTCARCHSIAGEGNPRNPLDGAAEVYSAEELREWITGGDSLQDKLPEYILRLKQKYKKLSDDDLESLVIYLQNL